MLSALAWFAWRLYREHRTDIYGLGDRKRGVLYASAGLARADGDRHGAPVGDGPGTVVWFALVRARLLRRLLCSCATGASTERAAPPSRARARRLHAFSEARQTCDACASRAPQRAIRDRRGPGDGRARRPAAARRPARGAAVAGAAGRSDGLAERRGGARRRPRAVAVGADPAPPRAGSCRRGSSAGCACARGMTAPSRSCCASRPSLGGGDDRAGHRARPLRAAAVSVRTALATRASGRRRSRWWRCCRSRRGRARRSSRRCRRRGSSWPATRRGAGASRSPRAATRRPPRAPRCPVVALATSASTVAGPPRARARHAAVAAARRAALAAARRPTRGRRP